MLYDKIKALCDEKNMSIRALEREAKLSTGTIAKWSNEISNPTYMSVVAVCNVLKMEPHDLMKDEVEKFNNREN